MIVELTIKYIITGLMANQLASIFKNGILLANRLASTFEKPLYWPISWPVLLKNRITIVEAFARLSFTVRFLLRCI